MQYSQAADGKKDVWMYSTTQFNNGARILASHYWFGMSLCWPWTTSSFGFLVSFCLFLVSTKKETLSAALVTHMVQWAVSVGEIKSFQAVGLTQEVVEMLKRKKSTKLVVYPWGSFSGCVEYSIFCFILSTAIFCHCSKCVWIWNWPLHWPRLHAQAFCHQITNRNLSYHVKN